MDEQHLMTATVKMFYHGLTLLITEEWLESPRGRQYFPWLRVPAKYRPKDGDKIVVAFTLTKKPGNKRRSWIAEIVGWPQERSTLQDQIGYDS